MDLERILWNTNGSGLQHGHPAARLALFLAPTQGSARSASYWASFPSGSSACCQFLLGPETQGLEKAGPEQERLRGLPGNSWGPGLSGITGGCFRLQIN